MSTELIVEAVVDLEGRVKAFRDRIHPDAVAATIADQITKTRARFDADGINLVPEDGFKAYEQHVRQHLDEAARAEGTGLATDMDATDRALDATIGIVGQLPDPHLTADGASGTEIEMRKLRVGLELDRWQRKLEGRSFAAIGQVYEHADDTRDHAMRWFIERDAAAGWPDLAPTNTTLEDTRAMVQLTHAIAAAQRKRVEKAHPHLLEARTRLKALRSLNLGEQIRHLASGRGIALVKR